MNLMPGEKVLCQLKKADTVLTNFRIRRDTGLTLTSLMLEHVTACKVKKTSHPIFIVLSVLCGIALFYAINVRAGTEAQFWPGVGASLFFIAYIFTRSQNVQISSPSGVIEVELKRISYDEAIQFIEEVEEAIRYRALEGVRLAQVEAF